MTDTLDTLDPAPTEPLEADWPAEVSGDEPTYAEPVGTQALALTSPPYTWCTWLADVLRAAGLQVVEYPGWQTRGRPPGTRRFTPRGMLIHHDASAVGATPAMARFCAAVGRPDVPPPLSQLWLGKDGVWHVLAAGRANHAGAGQVGPIPLDSGNAYLIGVEWDHTVGEPVSAVEWDSYTRGCAAILAHLGADETWLWAHREYAPGRKVDPSGVDMTAFRTAVASLLHPVAPPPPPEPTPVSAPAALRRGDRGDIVYRLQQGLLRVFPAYARPISRNGGPNGVFGPATEAVIREFQRRVGIAADGIVGALTRRHLARFGIVF